VREYVYDETKNVLPHEPNQSGYAEIVSRMRNVLHTSCVPIKCSPRTLSI